MNNLNKNTNLHISPFKQLLLPLFLCIALATTMPVCAQFSVMHLSPRYGTDNPLDTFAEGLSFFRNNMVFADLDGDNDYDVFQTRSQSSNNYLTDILYYENIGDANSPLFQEKFGTDNPFDTIDQKVQPTFVDIDADGDLDVFTSSQTFGTAGYRYLHYYENVGTATNPSFLEHTGSANPLDTVPSRMTGLNLNVQIPPSPNFVDIDADGDLDCFVFYFQSKTDYYKNEGTASNPVFVLQDLSANPTNLLVNYQVVNLPVFYDFDQDNDIDYLVNLSGNSVSNQLLENTGDSASASFSLSTVQLLDSTLNGASLGGAYYDRYSFVDIDGDGDLDVFEAERFNIANSPIRYYENMEIVVGLEWRDNSIEKMGIFPNPSSGRINFTKAMKGKLFVYGREGRVLKSMILNEEQSVDLSDMPDGLYYMIIDEGKERFEGTVLINK